MTPFLPLLALLLAGSPVPSDTGRVVPNDNRVAAGRWRGDTLTLRLVARVAEWHPDGDAAPGAPVQAFAEEGGRARIPGPLLRARAGTVVMVTLRNALGDTLRVYGLHARPRDGQPDATPLLIAPQETRSVRFALDAPGTYLYWGTTTGRPIGFRTGIDAQLSGAIVVDPPGTRARDRIFVIGGWSDTVHRAGVHRDRVLAVLNGRSWPNTERLAYTVGDTARWRVINASFDLHPMHLHGFYFRVTSRGNGTTDSVYATRGGATAGDLAVTEPLLSAATMTIEWVPERAGNWLFHCHIPEHMMARGPLGTPPPAHASHPSRRSGQADHARGGMGGLVVGVTVRPAPSVVAAGAARGAERRIRLLVRPTVGSTDATPLYAYAIHERGAEPPSDTGLVGAPTLDLVRGQPVAITVVNRLPEPTGVHWHGIELESYYDGVPGFSGAGRRVTPMIAAGDSFVARFTPPRAGTFMYHTHANELRQQAAGLAGILLVREPGASRDSAVDVPLVVTSPPEFELNRQVAFVNGRAQPAPLAMTVGTTYRLRLAYLSAYRAGMTVELRRGDSLLTWRGVAKDGAELPGGPRPPQPARAFTTIGETQDYLFTPTEPGELRLEVRYGGQRLGYTPRGGEMVTLNVRGPAVIAATVPIRVGSAPAGR